MRQNFSDIELGKLPEAFVERTAPVSLDYDGSKFGEAFPRKQWSDQTGLYASLWEWYSGDVLAELRNNDQNDQETQYPLHMNVIRTICKKHASVLFGEVPDGPQPLVKIVVKARQPFDGTEPKEADKKMAEMCERIINEVVSASYGRARQLENGIYSQFLGGHVFQLSYQPTRTDLLIPIVMQNPRPDYFLPVWKNEDPYALSECWTVYQIPEVVAKRQYGITEGRLGEKAVFAERWTDDLHEMKINNQIINDKLAGTGNPFEIVPAVYIPHARVGSNYGIGHIQDIAALEKEYNANTAALGEAVLQTPDRDVYLSNSYGKVIIETLSDGREITNIGFTPAASGSKDAPRVTFGEQPQVSEAMIQYVDKLWKQILRDSDLSSIPFGEDEGSQRSGQTLALRMFPTISHIKQERTYWNDGLTKLAWHILKMVRYIQISTKLLDGLGINLPEDYRRKLEISTEWSPAIPQDRKQLVDETGILVPVGVRSVRQAVEMLRDARDIEVELKEIEQDKEKEAERTASLQAKPFGANGSKPNKATGAVTPSTNGETVS